EKEPVGRRKRLPHTWDRRFRLSTFLGSGPRETYGAMGAGTDGYAVGAGQADRPRPGQQLGSVADARPIRAAVEGFAAPRPGMSVDRAAPRRMPWAANSRNWNSPCTITGCP